MNFFFNDSYAVERWYDQLREDSYDEELDLFEREEDIDEEEEREYDDD